jgi:hypothetical protein
VVKLVFKYVRRFWHFNTATAVVVGSEVVRVMVQTLSYRTTNFLGCKGKLRCAGLSCQEQCSGAVPFVKNVVQLCHGYPSRVWCTLFPLEHWMGIRRNSREETYILLPVQFGTNMLPIWKPMTRILGSNVFLGSDLFTIQRSV